MTKDLLSIGMSFDRWQDAVEAAIASNQLEVTGEVRGGQLIQFTDLSGAQINILAVEPFATYAGFDATTALSAHVTMVNDVLALCDIVNDDGYHLATITTNLAQGPLLVDEPTQQWQQLGLTALAMDTRVYASKEEAKAAETLELGTLQSAGADIVTKGLPAAPDAAAAIVAEVIDAEYRTNALTNQRFIHAIVEGPFRFDICLPVNENLPRKGSVIAGDVVLTGALLAPAGCGDGGGCGSGGCGGSCGGH